MSEECEEIEEQVEMHRYLYTVRQRFGQAPELDTFYEVTIPDGVTGEQAKIMNTLSDGKFCTKEIETDNNAMRGISMRLRFNSDMYQSICLVKSECELDAETLEMVIAAKHIEGTLMKFLDDSAINY